MALFTEPSGQGAHLNRFKRAESKETKTWRSLPRSGFPLVLAAFAFSLFLHLGSYFPVSYIVTMANEGRLDVTKSAPVKVKIVKVEPEPKKEDEFEPDKQVVEVPLPPTEKPDQADYAGAQDHATDRRTKVADDARREEAADPGLKGQGGEDKPQPMADQPHQRKPEEVSPKAVDAAQQGDLSFAERERKKYETYLPQSQDLLGQINAGYQDYIDDQLEEAEMIDVNTTDYRYIGYITVMRKSIELVWKYPSEAVRRGMRGEVTVYWRVEKDGSVDRIKILKSSGYDILDDAIVEAIKLAQPFAPIPANVLRDHLPFRWRFRYVLGNYARSH